MPTVAAKRAEMKRLSERANRLEAQFNAHERRIRELNLRANKIGDQMRTLRNRAAGISGNVHMAERAGAVGWITKGSIITYWKMPDGSKKSAVLSRIFG